MVRSLTSPEKELIRWMLENGYPEANAFLSQLEELSAADWQCSCGCASINLVVKDGIEQTGSLHIVSEFVFGDEKELSGIFIYEKQGVLAGIEVYGLAGDAPTVLPSPEMLRSVEGSL